MIYAKPASVVVFAAMALGFASDADAQLLCRAKFLNSYPYGGAITSVFAQFYYSDGTVSTQGPSDRNITYGQAGYLYSRDNTSCVKKVFQALRYEVGGQAYPISIMSPDAPSGRCWTETLLEVVPATSVSEDDARSSDPKKRFASMFKVMSVGADGKQQEVEFEVHDSYDELVAKMQQQSKKDK